MPKLQRNPASAKPVGTLKFVLHSTTENDQQLFDEIVRKLGGTLIKFGKPSPAPGTLALDIKDEAARALGDDYTVTEIRASKGSVIVAVLVGTYAMYQGVSRYKSFIESIKLMGTHIESLLHRDSDDQPLSIVNVKQTWMPATEEKEKRNTQQKIHLKQ
jgi:hypothetical protein